MNPFDIAPIINNLPFKVESVAYDTEVMPGDEKVHGVVYLGTSDSQLVRYSITEGKQASKSGRMSMYLLKAPQSEQQQPQMTAKVVLRKHAVTQLEVVHEHKVVLALCGQELSMHDAVSLVETPESKARKEKDKSLSWKGCVSFAVEKARRLSLGNTANATTTTTTTTATTAGAGQRLCVLSGRGKKLTLYKWERRDYEFNREITLAEQCSSAEWCGPKHIAVATKKDVFLVDIDSGKAIPVRLPADIGASGSGVAATAVAAVVGSAAPVIATVDGTLFVTKGPACSVLSLEGAAVPWMMRIADGHESYEARAFSRFSGACSELVVEYPYLIGLQEQSVEIQYLETASLVQSLSFHDRFPFRIMKCGPFKKVLLGAETSVYMITMKPLDAQVDEYINLSKFRDALSLFQYSLKEVSLCDDPDNNAKYNSICLRSAEILLHKSKFNEAFDYFILSHADPRVLLSWFPDLGSGGTSGDSGGQKVAKKSVRAIIAARLEKPEESPEVASEYEKVEALLKDTLCAYKKQYDESIAGGEKGDTAVGAVRAVNTALLLFYTKTKSDLLDEFVAARPPVDFELCKARLAEAKCWNALGLLYRAEGLEEDALKMWRDQESGVTNTVELLIQTKDAKLVWEYVPWVLARHLSKGMRVFVPSKVSPASAALEGVDSAEVVAFLEAHTRDGTRAYLDYLITDAGERGQRDEYYTKLAEIYVEQTLECVDSAKDGKARAAAVVVRRPEVTEKELLRTCRALRDLLQSKSEHAAAAARVVLARYEAVFGKDIAMGAHREISVVKTAAYEKLGRPEDVLRVMIWEIGCQRRAEKYCLENRTPAEASHLLCALVRVCFEYDMRIYGIDSTGTTATTVIDNGNGEADLAAAFSRRALGLLCLYGARISPLEVLEAIPGATPIASLLPYFQSSLKEFSHRKREAEVTKSLSKANQLDEKCELVGIETDAFIRITDKTTCAQCHKLIGNSVFVKMPPPGNEVLCFRCYDNAKKEPKP